MLEKEFKHFEDNKEAFIKKYNGFSIVIRNNKVVGKYIDNKTALKESAKKYELGTFLIQKITDNKDDYIIKIFPNQTVNQSNINSI